MARRIGVARVLAGLAFLVAAAAASADSLVTTLGTRYEGKVAEEGDRYTVALPSGETMKFLKSMVREVTIGDKTVAVTPAAPAAGESAKTPAGETPAKTAPAETPPKTPPAETPPKTTAPGPPGRPSPTGGTTPAAAIEWPFSVPIPGGFRLVAKHPGANFEVYVLAGPKEKEDGLTVSLTVVYYKGMAGKDILGGAAARAAMTAAEAAAGAPFSSTQAIVEAPAKVENEMGVAVVVPGADAGGEAPHLTISRGGKGAEKTLVSVTGVGGAVEAALDVVAIGGAVPVNPDRYKSMRTFVVSYASRFKGAAPALGGKFRPTLPIFRHAEEPSKPNEPPTPVPETPPAAPPTPAPPSGG